MTAPERKIPAFFTVYVPELCSVRMKIPSRFTSYMKGKLPDSAAFLRDHCGNVWPVGVIREGRDLYFEKGWVRFVEDNGVETGDFLVFQFSGDYFYDFKHCGRTACGKETTSFNFTVKKEKSEGGEDNEEEDDTNYGNEKEDDEEEEDYVDDEDYEEDENVLFESSHAHVQIPTSTKRGKGKVVVKQEADLVNTFKRGYRGQKMGADIFKSSLIVQPENHHFVARQRLRKRNELKNSEEEVEENEKEDVDDDDESDDDFEEDDENEDDDDKEEDDDDDEDYEEEEDDLVKKTRMIKSMKEFESSYVYVQKPGTSTKRGKGGAVVKHEADIFKSGLILQPENPYFIDRLRKGTQNQLLFPKKLIKKHKLVIPEQIIITGEDGKGFVSRISRWSDGRSAATDGWTAFCRWNYVKEGEMFLCEFVTHQELLVRILNYRAGIWMPRPRI